VFAGLFGRSHAQNREILADIRRQIVVADGASRSTGGFRRCCQGGVVAVVVLLLVAAVVLVLVVLAATVNECVARQFCASVWSACKIVK
jgi:hypothetical protein